MTHLLFKGWQALGYLQNQVNGNSGLVKEYPLSPIEAGMILESLNYLPYYRPTYPPTYLPGAGVCPSTARWSPGKTPTNLPTTNYLPTNWCSIPTYKPTHLHSIHLPTYPQACPPTHLPTHPPIYPPTYPTEPIEVVASLHRDLGASTPRRGAALRRGRRWAGASGMGAGGGGEGLPGLWRMLPKGC